MPINKAPKAKRASTPRVKKEVVIVECEVCPKGKRTGKASGLQDENTLCPNCNGTGLVEA